MFKREILKLIDEGIMSEKEAIEQNLLDFNMFQQFDYDHFDLRRKGEPKPYRFGTYLIYQANYTSHHYKVINYVNTTS